MKSVIARFIAANGDVFQGHFPLEGMARNSEESDKFPFIDIYEAHHRLDTIDGDVGPHATYWVNRHKTTGDWWGVFYLGNDSLFDVVGCLVGKLELYVPGHAEPIIESDEIVIPDQQGYVVRFGTPFLAKPIPDDLFDVELETFVVPGRDFERKSDPDPTPSTHQTGSPRNKPYDRLLAAVKAGDMNGRLGEFLARQHDWTLAQCGCPSPTNPRERVVGRPHWVANYRKKFVEAYDVFTDYGKIDPDATGPIVFGEGVIKRPRYGTEVDSCGRKHLREGGSQPENGTLYRQFKNGHDHEHFEVESLRAMYLLTGCQLSKMALLTAVNTQLDRRYANWGTYSRGQFWSSRTGGWVALGNIAAEEVEGSGRYYAMVKRFFELVYTRQHHELMGWDPIDADLPYFQTREQGPEQYRLERDGVPIRERPWQTAPAVWAALRAKRLGPEGDRVFWDQILRWLLDVLECGWDESSGGFFQEYEIKLGSDGEIVRHGNPSLIGTAHWTLAAAAEAARELGLDMTSREFYTKLSEIRERHLAGHIYFGPGGDGWSGWHCNVSSLIP